MPQLRLPQKEKDTFYNQLQTVLEEIPSYDIKMLIGDFNANLDSDRRGLNATVGPYGSASSTNDNGERLLMLTSTNYLSIGNTFFKHKQIHNITWWRDPERAGLYLHQYKVALILAPTEVQMLDWTTFLWWVKSD